MSCSILKLRSLALWAFSISLVKSITSSSIVSVIKIGSDLLPVGSSIQIIELFDELRLEEFDKTVAFNSPFLDNWDIFSFSMIFGNVLDFIENKY